MRRLLDIETELSNDVLKAFAVLNKVPGSVDYILKYVNNIKYTDGRTHTDVTEGTVYLGEDHLNSDIVFLASTLVHEMTHRRIHKICKWVKAELTKEQEERLCIKKQAEFLEKAGYEMEGVTFNAEDMADLLYSQHLNDRDL